MNSNNHASNRRQLLKFLSASPYIAAGGGLASFLNSEGFAQDVRESSFVQIMRDRMSVVTNPKEALTVFDMEASERNTPQMLPTSTGISIKEVTKAHGRPVWQPFYAPNPWDASVALNRTRHRCLRRWHWARPRSA